MDKDTPPCYTQSFYISLRLNRLRPPPSPRLPTRIHPSSFKSARQDFWRWALYTYIKTTFSVSHLWLQNVLGILCFSIHTCFGHQGSKIFFTRWGTGLLITCSYRGLIVINSFLSYSSRLCSPSYWSRPAERYRQWILTRGTTRKEWKGPLNLR